MNDSADDHFIVKLAFDPEARVWFIEESNVIGLAGEANTYEDLVKRLPGLIADMVEENYPNTSLLKRPVDVIQQIRLVDAA